MFFRGCGNLSGMAKLSKEQQQALIQDRLSGLSREALAQKYNMSLAGVKSVLLRHKVALPMEQRQSNAYRAKLAKNPDAMSSMRKTLTSDVVARRNAAILNRYTEDATLRALKGEQSKAWWRNHGPESKYQWSDVRRVAAEKGFTIHDLEGSVDAESIAVTCHCGVVWETRVFDLLYGKVSSCGCVKSKPQAEMTAWLQSLGLSVATNDRNIIGPQELDIVIPDEKLAIEYCGLAWHGEYRKESRTYHLDKLKATEATGYRLITVFSDEWLTRQSAVKGFIQSALRQSPGRTKLGARDLAFSQISWEQASAFLDAHHIQGAGAPLAHCFGLCNQNEVLAVATFKPTNERRRGRREDGVWELVRYCVKPNLQLVGGFDKLFSNFKKLHNPTLVFSYSDRRWSQGGLYQRAGFVLESTVPPSYWYYKKNTETVRHHKSKFRKSSIGAGPNETEWEVMQRLGYDRIWDCGLHKWTLTVEQ